MLIRFYVFLNLVGLFAAGSVVAPAVSAQDDTQGWTALFVNGAPVDDSKALLWFDGHARFSEDVSRLGVSIIRPGVGYRVNDGLALWGGYARVVSRATGRDNITENRIWQQATFGIASGTLGTLTGRTRLEQRFLNTGDDTGWRVRQFFRWLKPVGDRWSVTAWNETFVHLNDTDFGAEAGFDQNRFFVGLRWRAFDAFSLEGGYLLNTINGPASTANNNNFSISIIAPL